jgi:hypothetical protein
MPANYVRHHFGHFVVLVGAVTIATAPLAIGNDGIVRFYSLDSLLRDGTFDRSKYSLYGPIAAAPLWYLGELVGYPKEVVWVFNRGAFLALLVGLWLALGRVLPSAERTRFAALLCFGSMFPWHVTGFFAEVFHATCVGLGLALLATRRGPWAAFGGVLAAWGTANVPATAVGLAFAACVLCWHHRRLRYLALPALAAALILLENAVRRGDPFAGGYAGEAGHRTALPYSGLPGFSYPLFFGLLSVLFSFGKGLVFFAPGLFARYPEGPEPDAGARIVYRVWLAVVVGLVLVYARWWAWYGGAVWGPRFFLFASLPAALVLARWTARAAEHSTRANAFVLVAVLLSCWVGLSGVVFAESGAERFWANDFALEYLNWYVPECSALWLPFVTPKALAWHDYPRFVAWALGGAYLAWPVGRVLAVRTWRGVGSAWRELRTGPRWRV